MNMVKIGIIDGIDYDKEVELAKIRTQDHINIIYKAIVDLRETMWLYENCGILLLNNKPFNTDNY